MFTMPILQVCDFSDGPLLCMGNRERAYRNIIHNIYTLIQTVVFKFAPVPYCLFNDNLYYSF